MEIKTASVPLPTITLNTARLAQLELPSLRVGQLLEAVVAKVDNANVTLQVDGKPLRASLPQFLAPAVGDKLTLQLASLSPPTFKVVSSVQGDAALLTQALRTALPRQGGFATLLANLGALSNVASAGQQSAAEKLPDALSSLIKQLLLSIASTEKIRSGDGLRQAVKQSGLFMEQSLAQTAAMVGKETGRVTGNMAGQGDAAQVLQQSQPQPQAQSALHSGDLKVALLKLLAGLRHEATKGTSTVADEQTSGEATRTTPTVKTAMPFGARLPQPNPPPLMRDTPLQTQATAKTAPVLQQPLVRMLPLLMGQLMEQVEGALARIQVNQLSTLQADGSAANLLTVELPLQHKERTDLLQIRFQRERNGGNGADDDKETPRWSALVALDLPQLGPLYARVSVVGEQVSTLFWAEQAATVTRLNGYLDELRCGLHAAGLDVAELRCRQGKPPQPGAPEHGTALLDVNV
ncbi:MAG: flagellar hook-length control protein FliK [Gammaproteobacteria bacterium]|nr:flagellar hook-length control protein FliK [Gammaproteobacteria bacterium]